MAYPKLDLSNAIVESPGKNLYRLMVKPSTHVLVMGENYHTHRAHKLEVVRALQKLRFAGFDCLALEVFPSDMTPILQAYSRSGEGAESIHAHLRKYFPQNPDYYISLLNSAREMGIGLIGIDMEYRRFIQGQLQDEHVERNKHMSDAIATQVAQGTRVVALMAVAHSTAFLGESVTGFLKKEHSIATVSITLTGGMDCFEQKNCFAQATSASRPDVLRAAQSNNLWKKRFFVKGNSVTSADYVLHLPQVPMASAQ